MAQLATLFAVSIMASASTADSETLVGIARVIDGDTLVIGEIIIRLADIDAPELGQKCDGPNALRSCGKVESDYLAEWIDGQRIECDVASIDDYDRSIASCSHQGEDISGWMVREGYALAFVRYSDRYVAEEHAARASEAGLWRATVEPPWEYRARRWDVAEQEAPEGCLIKGNISRSGKRIYHAPWSLHYAWRLGLSSGHCFWRSEAERSGLVGLSQPAA